MLKVLFVVAVVLCGVPCMAQVNEHNRPQLRYLQFDTFSISRNIDTATALAWRGAQYTPVALRLFDTTLSQSLKSNFHDGVVRSLIGIAACFYNERQSAKAIEKMQTALDYAKKTGITSHNGKLEGNLGIIYASNSDYIEAIEHYTNALAFYEVDSSDKGLGKGNVLLNIAGLLGGMRRDSLALFYIEQAEAEAEKMNSDLLRCWAYYHKSEIYFNLDSNNWAESEMLLLKALKIALVYNFQPIRASVLTLLGNLAAKSGAYHKALAYTKQALALPLNEQDKAENYLNLGIEYYHLKNYNAAITSLLIAREIVQRNNFSFEIKAGIYTALARAYRDTSFFDEATTYYQLASDAKDSIIESDLGKRIYGLEEKYEIAKRDKEIAQSQLLITQQREQLFRRKTWIISLVAFTVVASFGIFFYQRNRQHIQRQVQRQNLEAATWRATFEGEEKERSRIARELHDNIGGSLANLKMWFGSIRERPNTPETEKEYSEALILLDKTLGDVRSTSHSLMPELLLHEGLIKAVEFFCVYVQRASGIRIDYQYFGYIGDLDKSLELTLYRIIQELVQNVVKHASATHVLVQLSCHDTQLAITVEDNGKGMDALNTSGNKGLGLASIRRSITNLKGHFNMQSEPGSGTTIDIDIDLVSEVNKEQKDRKLI